MLPQVLVVAMMQSALQIHVDPMILIRHVMVICAILVGMIMAPVNSHRLVHHQVIPVRTVMAAARLADIPRSLVLLEHTVVA